MISNRSRIPMRPQQRPPEAAQPTPILQTQPQSAGASPRTYHPLSLHTAIYARRRPRSLSENADALAS
jgi:hypothetical protein